MTTGINKHTLMAGRDKTIIDLSESIAELHMRYKKLGEPTLTDTAIHQLVGTAIIDAFAVLDSMEDDEVAKIREDSSVMFSDEVIEDPIEAFTFNLIEEITTTFVASSRKDISHPFGFNATNLPLLIVYS